MKTPVEIKNKVEKRRKEIEEEAKKIKKEAEEKRICTNCFKPILDNRRKKYCSPECFVEFYARYDYSVNSPILKQYKNELLQVYKRKMEDSKEDQNWKIVHAKKEYKCTFCELPIKIGDLYSKYTVLFNDPDYIDYLYTTSKYHIECNALIFNMASVYDIRDGLDDRETNIFYNLIAKTRNISVAKFKENILKGEIPTKDELSGITEQLYKEWDMEYDF